MKPSSEAERIFSLFDAKIGSARPGDVDEAAAAFVTGWMLRAAADRTWVVCRDVRHQEDFAAELAVWSPGVRLFPELERPAGDVLPDPETASERLEILRHLAGGSDNLVVVIHAGQWEEEVPSLGGLKKSVLRLQAGMRLAPDEVTAKLVAAGYESAPQVTARGQFARRGGIMDVFSWQAARPVRLDWFDDTLDSLREFDVDSQAGIGPLEAAELLAADARRPDSRLADFRRPTDRIIDWEAPPAEDGPAFFPPPFAGLSAGDIVLDEAKRAAFFEQLDTWLDAGWCVVFAGHNEAEIERFRDLAADFEFDPGAMVFATLAATRSFICPDARFAFIADAEVFGRSASERARRASARRERLRSARTVMDFSEFEEGDFVVHLEHGIGRFLGMQKEPGGEADVLALEFAGDARLYVPLEQAWQVARYVGLGRKTPELSELGDGKWQRAKEKARRGIYEYAARMLKIQAERETGNGNAFPADGKWQREFEASFLFTETADQVRAITETKADMESDRPMDRLICGDVGFGKTEVAIRAAFKAVTSGKQAAFIAPTTVLAQQHYQTLRERMSDFPVTIELLSRYRTAAAQKKVIAGLADGSIDLVVGTHRVISKDVTFRDLGLVIVDEEQRFGVKHKDALKEKFRLVDVLTLSATPIPRTLYLALMGARDMSLIETPPPNRQPVETLVCAYDERLIRDAVTRELARGGQVYFLHNRVGTIEKTAARLRELCPGARVIVGHGQMEDRELEEVMGRFVSGAADVLVSTTIIESGLDIPNANTIIIDRADRFGLADLYQLRGRVGRSGHKAYAFLMLPRDLMSVGAARRRVSAIKQYTELGSGFKIAMRDLEIRGAGNLLGTAQSGHIVAVGFDLYCKLLRRAVDSMKGRRGGGGSARIALDFLRTSESDFVASESVAGSFLPSSYVSEPSQRIEAYRRLAEVGSREDIEGLRAAWRDRYGPLPAAADNALVAAAIRVEAARRRITQVEVREGKVMLTRGGAYVMVGGRFPRLTLSDPDSRLREVLSLLESMPAR